TLLNPIYIPTLTLFTHTTTTNNYTLSLHDAVPIATKQLAKIGEEIQEKWPDAEVSIAHRLGRLDISEVAVAIAVSTPHRDESFKACRYAIERIKEIVPIWKKEHWEDGTKWLG